MTSVVMAKRSINAERTAVLRDRNLSLDNAVLMSLGRELQELCGYVMTSFGLSEEDQRRLSAEKKTTARGRTARTSFLVLKTRNGLARLLALWKHDKKFSDKAGDPLVLKIHGKGRTFESLARECVPHMNIDEALATICKFGDVNCLVGDKVALLGTSALIQRALFDEKKPELAFATLQNQMWHLAETIILNSTLALDQRTEGLFQRQVFGNVPLKRFPAFVHSLKPRLQEMCDELDELIRREGKRSNRSEKEESCGFGLFAYRERNEIPHARKTKNGSKAESHIKSPKAKEDTEVTFIKTR